VKALVNGLEVYYGDVGDRRALPVVLIHGFPFNHAMWQPQIAVLEKRFRIIAYDLRGHGKSSVGDGQYTIEFYVDDLISLLDHLKVERAVLCGLSMGGYIALRAVERNPERIVGLILADTQAKADTNEAKLRRAASIRAVKTSGVKAYAEGLLKALFAQQSHATRTDAVDAVRNMIESSSPLGISGALLALAARTETTEALSSIRVPTLILVGEHDTLTPISASQEIHDKIPNSEMHVIRDAAHMSNLENPEAFNGHVLDFLGRLVWNGANRNNHDS
jgi:3-oxoadipate enol-lactonase